MISGGTQVAARLPRRARADRLALTVLAFVTIACGSDGDDGAPGPGGVGGQGGIGGAAATGGSSGSAAGAGTDGGADASVLACPTELAGPAMVLVSTAAGASYCIDSTEVTIGQYQEFLDANPPNGTQPPYCSWNATFEPNVVPSGQCDVFAFPEKKDDYPISCIDWCDAAMYCGWAGKRLCGKVGGGSVTVGEAADANIDEWFNACSLKGTKAYPYGSVYEGETCNGTNGGGIGIQLSEGLSMCEGGFPGLFQMSGNAGEWEDACDSATGESDLCPVRGGTPTSGANDLACAAVSTLLVPRGDAFEGAGIRCCADLVSGR